MLITLLRYYAEEFLLLHFSTKFIQLWACKAYLTEILTHSLRYYGLIRRSKRNPKPILGMVYAFHGSAVSNEPISPLDPRLTLVSVAWSD